MYSAVERILSGKFNKDAGALSFSGSRIDLSVREGQICEGSFTVFGPENLATEGRVTSNSLRMQCVNGSFSGSREEIAYRFDSGGMEEGESVEGEFCIVSNRGEYSIPFKAVVESEAVESSLGTIRNLFHFANLARTNFDEAVSLFYSERFARVFQGADRQYASVYRGLSEGEIRPQRVEEFLLEIRKKQKVDFLLEEEEIRIENPRENAEYKVVINRNGWGYSQLNVEAEGDFLVLEKSVIRDEDFLGNCCRLPFYLSQKNLHRGKNLGSIRLYNAYSSLQVTVQADVSAYRARIPGLRSRKNHLTVELMQYYEAFRVKKISVSSWMQETEKIVGQLMELDERDLSARLFQVQLLITREQYQEAAYALDQMKDEVEERFRPEVYCYYLYLTTLLNRNEAYVDEVAAQVERIFVQNAENWRIAWLLLYLSGDYERSPSRKWIALEEQCRLGCGSPVIYIEAWNLILSNVMLLTRLEGFELRILTYAAKKDLLNETVANHIVYLASKQKVYSDRVFYLLRKCWQIAPGDETLCAICTLLIKGNRTGAEHFVWYALGIERELRITRLYEYYMMSCELTENLVIPKMVLMYFAFDSSLDSFHNAFLYTYMHKRRQEYPELYENYRDQIEKFTVFQVLRGRNNKWLAYLYQNIITPGMVTLESVKALAGVIFIRRLQIKRGDICQVAVVYEKKRKTVFFPVSSREAYLPIYGSDCRIFLEDTRGNRYCRQEEYEMERLLVPDKLALLCAPFVQEDDNFTIWLCERGKSLAVVNEDNAWMMKRIAGLGVLTRKLEQEIRMNLIHFFYDHDLLGDLDELLGELAPEQIGSANYTETVQFMVVRGMYEKAYQWIRQRGGFGVEPKIIMRLCSRLLAFELADPSDTMTALVHLAFCAGKYDDNLLNYLIRHYRGSVRSMRDIWKAGRAFGAETYELSERILIQMMYSGAYIGEKTEIFRDYISGGARSEVEEAFLAQESYDYFVCEKVTDEFVIQDMHRAMERGEKLSEVCCLAYVKYFSENKRQITEEVSRFLVRFLRELLSRNICFPFFKEYAEPIAFMRQFADKTMIEYRMEEGKKAMIHYRMERDGESDTEYVREEMKDMFCGICVKPFILFFGEKLQYYIMETDGEKEYLTQSGMLSRLDTDREKKESKYSLLNDISIGRALNDDETMESLLYEYFEREYMADELFRTI